MLEIIVDRKHTLQLPIDIAINFIEENPLFLNDRIPAPHSLSFEVPATHGNLKAFGFPNRVTSISVIKKIPAEIRHTGLILGRGEILLLEVTDVLKLQFTGSRSSVNIKAPMNVIDSGEEEFGEFKINPKQLDYTGLSYNYAHSLYNISQNPTTFAAAPVKRLNQNWIGDKEEGGVLNSVFQYINFFYPDNNNYLLNGIDIKKFRSPIFPFLSIHTLIDNIFGDKLEHNPFADGDLNKLYLITTRHKNFHIWKFRELYSNNPAEPATNEAYYPLLDDYSLNANGNVDIVIRFKYFMQRYLFVDFLKELLKIFCMTAYPGTLFKIEFANDVMSRKNQVSWDSKIAGDPVISYEKGKKYIFKYRNSGSADGAANPLPFSSMKAIFDYAYSNTEVIDNTFLDQSSGAEYNITRELHGLESNVVLTSVVKKSPLITDESESDSELEKFEVSSEVSPLPMNLHTYWGSDKATTPATPLRHWFVPELDISKDDDPPHIMFYGGRIGPMESVVLSYPCMMAHHTDHFGVRRLNTSLHPGGEDGLIEKFHGKLKAWYAKDKMKVKGSFRLTIYEMYKLDIRDKVSLQGKLFYIQKINYTLTNTAIGLVDADLIEV